MISLPLCPTITRSLLLLPPIIISSPFVPAQLDLEPHSIGAVDEPEL
jgi:hypothetical protein